MSKTKTDRGILTCPNGHMYNGNKYQEICPNCGAVYEDESKTQEELEQELKVDEADYVCGYLVCIEGVNKGRGYKIKPGKNSVGSSPVNDIWIEGDPELLKENHAVIMYDNDQNQMVLLGHASNGMVYIGKTPIYDSHALDDKTRITMGTSVYRYLEFCDSDFDWTDK